MRLERILKRERSNVFHPQFYVFTVIPMLVSLIYLLLTSGAIPGIDIAVCSGGWYAIFIVQLLI